MLLPTKIQTLPSSHTWTSLPFVQEDTSALADTTSTVTLPTRDYQLTEIDSIDWTGFDEANRKASHNFQMMISPQIHPDPSQPELEGYDANDWSDGEMYLHTVQPSTTDPRGSLELVYSTPGYSYPWFGRKTAYVYDEGGRVLSSWRP